MGKIKLGQEVKDKISGFQGIAESVTEFLYGCRRIGIASRELSKDGKLKEVLVFDEPQLEIISNGILTEPVKEEKRNYGSREFKPSRHSANLMRKE